MLGPNGAGKSTTISICTTRSLPTSGRVVIAGYDVVAKPAMARRQIGVVPQYNTLDRSLTAFENLFFHCRYFGMSDSTSKNRAKELLTQFRLADRAKAFPSELSGGLAQRLLVARDRSLSRGSVPRRAKCRPRSAKPPGNVGVDPRTEGPRHHRIADHPLHGRGGSAV